MKTNQEYQLLAENLPASPHAKTPEIIQKPKTPLASLTPNNPTKEFWYLHEIQHVYLDFASFPQLLPLTFIMHVLQNKVLMKYVKNVKNLK
jgi:hypothetical protein